LKEEKLTRIEKANLCTKTEAYKLYSRVFWTFLPNLRVFWDTVYYRGRHSWQFYDTGRFAV